MFRDLTSNWKTELIKRKMSEGGDADKVNFLFPIRAGGEFRLGRTRGWFRARIRRRENRCSRTIRTWRIRFPVSGI